MGNGVLWKATPQPSSPPATQPSSPPTMIPLMDRVYDCTPVAIPVLPAPLGSVNVNGRKQPAYTHKQQEAFGVDAQGNPSRGTVGTWPDEQRMWCCRTEGVGCSNTKSGVAPADVQSERVKD